MSSETTPNGAGESSPALDDSEVARKRAILEQEFAELDRVSKEVFGGKEHLIDHLIEFDLSVIPNNQGEAQPPTK